MDVVYLMIFTWLLLGLCFGGFILVSVHNSIENKDRSIRWSRLDYLKYYGTLILCPAWIGIGLVLGACLLASELFMNHIWDRLYSYDTPLYRWLNNKDLM